jgi:hypothetical protein
MLRIIGVERTQAIQYFGSTYPVCANAQPCADNSIPLVAGRPTVLRVYFDGATPNAQVTGLGVKVLPNGAPGPDSFPSRATLVNVPSPPRREQAGDSINLLVPAALSAGQWKMNISLFELGVSGLANVASTQVELQFTERGLLPLRLVRLHYKRVEGGVTVAEVSAPEVADFWATAEGFVFHAWPSPLPVFCMVRDTVEVFDGDYSRQNPGVDTPATRGTTGSITQILARLRAAERLPPHTLYCMFFPDSGLRELPQGGYAGGRDFITPNGYPQLMAHELGHALGRGHSFEDPGYPRYGALAPDAIGEVGFDALDPPVVNPPHPPPGKAPARSVFDVMSYGDTKWISPYTYVNLFQTIGALTASGGCPSAALPPQGEFYPEINRRFDCYFVAGLPHGDILRAICGPKLPVLFPPLPFKVPGSPLPGRATVLGHDNQSLWTEPFEAGSAIADDVLLTPDAAEAHVHRRWPAFSISVPEINGAARLLVEYEGKVIEDSELSSKPVPLRANAYVLDGKRPAVRAEWVLDPDDQAVPVFVRASSDGGKSWTAFNVPDGATQRDIDLMYLPVGDSCTVEVLAGARLRTTAWRSEALPVRTGYESLVVLQPCGEARVDFGVGVALSAVSANGAGFHEIIWSSHRDGDIGSGGHLVASLSPGTHRLSVRRGPCGKRVPAGLVRVAGRKR